MADIRTVFRRMTIISSSAQLEAVFSTASERGDYPLTNTWNTFLANSRRFITAFIARLTRLTPVEDKNTSWAQPIKSYAEVPDAFKGFFEPLLADGRAFPYTVLTPTFEGYLHPTTEKLICNLEGEVCVLERTGNTYLPQCYPLEGISYLEVRTVLLDSRIKITGVTKNGISASSTLKFNTATDILFTPILEYIRLAAIGSREGHSVSESEKFDLWMSTSFKFMSYARRSLLAGEKVIQAILQPEIRAVMMRFLGMTLYRRISPTFASILTDREFILIREEEKQFASEKYGGIWDYIPLNKIEKISLIPKDTTVLALTIQLPHNDRLECLFQSSAKGEVDQLIDRLKKLTAA
jgi:hypothetical protein